MIILLHKPMLPHYGIGIGGRINTENFSAMLIAALGVGIDKKEREGRTALIYASSKGNAIENQINMVVIQMIML